MRFNRRDHREGESAEQYTMTLYELVKNCDYGDLRDDMPRDRLVVGIRDTALSEKLQMDAKLTLDITKKPYGKKKLYGKNISSYRLMVVVINLMCWTEFTAQLDKVEPHSTNHKVLTTPRCMWRSQTLWTREVPRSRCYMQQM